MRQRIRDNIILYQHHTYIHLGRHSGHGDMHIVVVMYMLVARLDMLIHYLDIAVAITESFSASFCLLSFTSGILVVYITAGCMVILVCCSVSVVSVCSTVSYIGSW